VSLRVYLANHSGAEFHYLNGKYGRMGWLLGPTSFKLTKLRPFVKIAFDNDAFGAFQNNKEWDEKAWIEMIGEIRLRGIQPEWVLAPDTVGDWKDTLRKYFAYSCYLHGFKRAIAVQDGARPQDIPPSVDVIFVGGTLRWKWKTLSMWCNAFPHVHCGRVNRLGKLLACERLGVKSIDGTGWFRREPAEWMEDLVYFFENKHEAQQSFIEVLTDEN
jgi:hypothetical protein